MICGWQTEYGVVPGRLAFCAERKGDGLPLCERHHEDAVAEYGTGYTVPENVALGAVQWALRLLWEGEEPDQPVEATAEEIARYAAILDPARGE
jgi:hypothetical protein